MSQILVIKWHVLEITVILTVINSLKISNCGILTKDLDVSLVTSSDDIWLDWVNAFLEICNKHAPIKNIRVKKSRYSPWMTPDNYYSFNS